VLTQAPGLGYRVSGNRCSPVIAVAGQWHPLLAGGTDVQWALSDNKVCMLSHNNRHVLASVASSVKIAEFCRGAIGLAAI